MYTYKCVSILYASIVWLTNNTRIWSICALCAVEIETNLAWSPETSRSFQRKPEGVLRLVSSTASSFLFTFSDSDFFEVAVRRIVCPIACSIVASLFLHWNSGMSTIGWTPYLRTRTESTIRVTIDITDLPQPGSNLEPRRLKECTDFSSNFSTIVKDGYTAL